MSFINTAVCHRLYLVPTATVARRLAKQTYDIIFLFRVVFQNSGALGLA